MQIRFFNDWGGPEGKPRLLIGLAADEPDRGQAREAVRVATPEDVTSYPAAYAAYEAAMTALQKEAGDADAAPASETAASSSRSSSRSASSSGSSGSSSSGASDR